jgi:hypothetical protein
MGQFDGKTDCCNTARATVQSAKPFGQVKSRHEKGFVNWQRQFEKRFTRFLVINYNFEEGTSL